MGSVRSRQEALRLHLLHVAALGAMVVSMPLFAGGNGGSTWPELFVPACNNGGCNDYQPQCPNDIQYFYSTEDSISIKAANTDGQTCMTIDAYPSCRFLLGDGGVTRVSFDFSIDESCYKPESQIAWLSFWMRSQPYSSNAEVDFVESKHGPAVNGLNINFDAHGTQVPIYCDASGDPTSPACTPSSGDWTGSIQATFSGPANSVSATVSSSVNGNVGTSTLTGGPTSLDNGQGFYFLMDLNPQDAGLTISTDCTIEVSNLEVQGTVPSTLSGNPNCEGLPVTSN